MAAKVYIEISDDESCDSEDMSNGLATCSRTVVTAVNSNIKIEKAPLLSRETGPFIQAANTFHHYRGLGPGSDWCSPMDRKQKYDLVRPRQMDEAKKKILKLISDRKVNEQTIHLPLHEQTEMTAAVSAINDTKNKVQSVSESSDCPLQIETEAAVAVQSNGKLKMRNSPTRPSNVTFNTLEEAKNIECAKTSAERSSNCNGSLLDTVNYDSQHFVNSVDDDVILISVTHTPKAHSVASAPSKAPSTMTPSERNKPASSPSKEAKQKKRRMLIKSLKQRLDFYGKEIKRLMEAELTLDEMDSEESSYIQECKLKEKYSQTYTKLCKLEGVEDYDKDNMYSRISIEGCPYPEVNREAEKYIRSRKKFPDFFDIKNVVSLANKNYKLRLRSQEELDIAREVFSEIGDKLQRKRKREFSKLSGNYLTDKVKLEDDPALLDNNLKKKLKKNKKVSKSKTEDVFKRFSRLQYEGHDTDEEEITKTVVETQKKFSPCSKPNRIELKHSVVSAASNSEGKESFESLSSVEKVVVKKENETISKDGSSLKERLGATLDTRNPASCSKNKGMQTPQMNSCFAKDTLSVNNGLNGHTDDQKDWNNDVDPKLNSLGITNPVSSSNTNNSDLIHNVKSIKVNGSGLGTITGFSSSNRANGLDVTKRHILHHSIKPCVVNLSCKTSLPSSPSSRTVNASLDVDLKNFGNQIFDFVPPVSENSLKNQKVHEISSIIVIDSDDE